MSTDYNYDDQGQFFPYFILTVTGLVTIPLTYSLLKPSKDLENTAPRIKSSFRPPHADLIDGQKRKQWRRERRIKRIITVVIGWGAMAWMVYLIIVTATLVPKLWDPYDILDISRSADEKAIKSHYKRLSLKYHPDKIRPDPALNETMETLNERFVDLTKAYKALTDEEVRNNFIQYGHPDGKQSFSIGIALPKFIVTDGNGKYVLLVYGLLLGVLLPYVVGKWWYGSQRVTKEKVLVASAGKIFTEYEESLSQAATVRVLSAGEEYRDVLSKGRAESGLNTIEARTIGESGAETIQRSLTAAERTKWERLDIGVRRKALALLWAYLGRVELGEMSLDDEKYEVAPIALALNESFLAIALAFGNTAPILSSFRTSQNLIQALPPGASPLLQLPHITDAVAQAIDGPGAKTHATIQQFMRMSDDKRRHVAIGPGLLSDGQYQTAMAVARQIPVLRVEKAFFKVTGERFITPSSLVQFVVKARFVPPGRDNLPAINPSDLEDVDPDEGDLTAILGRASKKGGSTVKTASATKPSNAAAIQAPLAYAPYFARDHSPRWHVFLADSKQGKMAVPPFTFSVFTEPLFSSTNPAEPSFAMQTLKMQFQAPPQPGQYTFAMHLICDSYVGMDSTMEVTLPVEDAARAEAMVAEDDISEPDEDSLAGQMHALKTGGISTATSGGPKRSRPRKRASDESDEEDDDESDTEGEDGEDEDASATDTETESEGEGD
ncbi:MAG: secretory subunit [Thelocarpon superellum]|nr:MAG: secretory subunit [Thelocarpon superellum]